MPSINLIPRVVPPITAEEKTAWEKYYKETYLPKSFGKREDHLLDLNSWVKMVRKIAKTKRN